MKIGRPILVSMALLLLAGCGNRLFLPRAPVDVKASATTIAPRKAAVKRVKPVRLAKVNPPRPTPRPAKLAISGPRPAVKLARTSAKPMISLAALTPFKGIKPSANAAVKAGQAAMCGETLTAKIPARSADAPTGSQLVKQEMAVSGPLRDSVISAQLLNGNMPEFMRHLVPVTLRGTQDGARNIAVTICVTPDYLSVGTDSDFVRVPMGLPAAAKVADKFDFLLPTTRMVDAIYQQAGIQLSPSPMQASKQMSSTSYLWRHNNTVEGQRNAINRSLDILTAGQKKDLVLSNVLRTVPGRVAIYGWHRINGTPIQPLSTVHGKRYADYSHGIRLISDTAYVNGEPRPLADLLQDPKMAAILSKEGPISRPHMLIASLYTH